MSDLPAINPCRLTGKPAVLQTRKEFHDGDTLEAHMARYGMTTAAIPVVKFAQEIAKDAEKEAPQPWHEKDFRVAATVGQNATGWRHVTELNEPIGTDPQRTFGSTLGLRPEMVESQRQQAMIDCIKEWNAANPVANPPLRPPTA